MLKIQHISFFFPGQSTFLLSRKNNDCSKSATLSQKMHLLYPRLKVLVKKFTFMLVFSDTIPAKPTSLLKWLFHVQPKPIENTGFFFLFHLGTPLAIYMTNLYLPLLKKEKEVT